MENSKKNITAKSNTGQNIILEKTDITKLPKFGLPFLIPMKSLPTQSWCVVKSFQMTHFSLNAVYVSINVTA